MTVSLEEQLRSLAAASLEPPSEVEPSDDNRPPRSTRTLWVACAAAMVAVVLISGVLVSRVDRTGPTASAPTTVGPDALGPRLYDGWPQPSLEDLAASASTSPSADLVVVGVIDGTGSPVASPAPADAPGTLSYSPVALTVETVIRNRSERDIPEQLTIRDWTDAADVGPHLSVLPAGTRVVAFVQEKADALDDGTDTVSAVFLVDDDDQVQDPATGETHMLFGVMVMFGPKGPGELIGLDAPAVRGTALDGTTVDLDSYRGQWVVIHVFASWCTPCRTELPELVEVARDRPDVQFLTLIFDDTTANASSVLAAAGVDWPALATTGDGREQVLLDYRITGVPELVVVRPDGTVGDAAQGRGPPGAVELTASSLLDALG